MSGIPLFQVDAFADRPFTGNPAAVCLMDEWPNDIWLQNVAAEMNLAETAFIVRQDDGFRLRWFTPKVEVDLCGHATLASAHVLWQESIVNRKETIRFHTRSGVLSARQQDDFIELDFPLTPPDQCAMPAGLADGLHIKSADYVGRNRMDILVVLANEQAVRSLEPDFRLLSRLAVRGIIVTALADDPTFDFVSRFFAPACGIDEDPVTGSAHCCLAAYWHERLGKDSFRAYQASARGGIVSVRVSDSRALLAGPAITILSGMLRV